MNVIKLEPRGEFVVRSYAPFTLTYTAGRYGIDDSGAIRVAFRMVGDWGRLQTDDPAAPNYVSAGTSSRARLVLAASPDGMNPRPRNKCLTIRVTGGYLEGGSPSPLFLVTHPGAHRVLSCKPSQKRLLSSSSRSTPVLSATLFPWPNL